MEDRKGKKDIDSQTHIQIDKKRQKWETESDRQTERDGE
jgi:hypothetical protein